MSLNTKVTPASQSSDSQSQIMGPQRAPVSGTMARVIARAPEPPETLAELPSVDDDREEEATRISSPLRILQQTDDEELTCQYQDLPTRVMHPAEDSAPLTGDAPRSSTALLAPQSSRRPEPSAPRPAPGRVTPPPASVRTRPLAMPATTRGDTAISQPLQTPPPPASAIQPIASVVVTDGAAHPLDIERSNPLELERALLRALTATAPRLVMPPVVAIRPAAPSARMLAIVATFTTLGLMWVMAVCAMILVLVTR